MADRPAEPDRTGAADLEYDLAHDAATDAVPGQRRAMHLDRPSTVVATETSDTASDYGYDLAHDIPKA
jgi:hypothetical protein